ncbi:MAG: HIT domain-containing protein [Caldimicrobium sp.]|nr:HIT domain-containing protein [Caldimicrobium sp.]MCX7613711.1 HIT domain-containing protein [Caldimicrobium sp.]MDW8183130.1 HIT domain-containing protein [Caldimicrobium sp.]
MKRNILWAPWRGVYVNEKKREGCIFCPPYEEVSPEERPILFFDDKVMVMLNKFPYNTGHLLIAPVRHVAEIEDLEDDEALAMMQMTQRCLKILKGVLEPQGFNVGFNIGKVAGAGYPDHLHLQIVPRWEGDVNFLTLLGDVRLASHHYLEVYQKLKPYFRRSEGS